MSVNKSTNKFQEILKNDSATLSFTDHIKEKYKVGWVNPSPCMEACPAGVNVKSYISLIAAGKFHDALKVVRERNPLPGICGRICTHPCETSCNRNEIDEPVAICWLKRFIADYELKHPMPKPEKIAGKRREKIAVIGSGPAGLTTAHDLALLGYKVTIFEELSEPGGMLIAGIPSYRMPRDILKVEIDYIKDLGVEIKTNSRIKGKNAVEGLIQKGFNAVFIAIGAHQGKKLNVPGEEDFVGFLDAVTFLRGVNFDKPKKPGDKVIVIGGGNSAIDAARTAIRLNCEDVNIVYRRTRNEMPANDAEIEEAENEGVNIHYLAAPVKIIGINGKVTGMECVKMELGVPDESGRRRPIPIKGSEYVIDADVIIPAISQEPDLTFLPASHKLNISKWNTFVANESTMETNIPGVFAGGDAVTGPNTVIDAISQGHIAAESIDRFINGISQQRVQHPTRKFETEIACNLKTLPKTKRAEMPMEKVESRTTSFDEVEFGFDEAQAIAEAQRCLRCGPCDECYTCVPECDKGLAILANDEGDCLLRYPPNFPIHENQNEILQGELKSTGKGTIKFQVNPIVPTVKEKLCRGCGDCVKVCEYGACELVQIGDEVFVSRINPDICRGCGTCVAFCPSSAIQPGHFTSNWLEFKLQNIKPKTKNVVVFSCNWNGSTFDLNTGKTNVIYINAMCTGRIETSFILKALELGADGVLITGCSTEECHYEFGATKFIETYDKTKKLADMLGIADKKIGYEQIPSADTYKFIESVKGFIKQL
ncbi:MAG: FAD-dependent oxidoreductase [Candidatus Marinimicrobia bacterium]|nr:FAD-dependent oxidoreductase [Candidatus Neomarinimicrobiota bacterium]MBL7022699.1 FAD-dependent oxidoreductase [Candidatus Neomarinimicrobiota bacterium]MBL7109172.1 FAD-dependent oxidoreductase [Candidatus Neomarinimicrobiota bacterium]